MDIEYLIKNSTLVYVNDKLRDKPNQLILTEDS